MTKPISYERSLFLQERGRLVEKCIQLAQAEMHAMTSGGAKRDDLFNALRTFTAERTAIAIELRALHEFNVTP